MKARMGLAVTALSLALLWQVGAALAAGAGGGTTFRPSVKTCPDGYYLSERGDKCKRCRANSRHKDCRRSTSSLSDEQRIEMGWALSYAGQHDVAITAFRQVADQRQPEVLNGLGYAHRKLGMLAEAIRYYEKALALDPDYVLAREYLGEGFVAAGRFDLAKEQLREIEKRCGTVCDEYADLARAIETGKETNW